MPPRLQPEAYHALAARRGLVWLGPEVLTSEKTRWRCPKGHILQARYFDIARYGCRTCGIERRTAARRLTPEAYHARARDAGMVWLGPEVPNASTITRWLCPEGHIWEARYFDVGRYGCRVCGNERKVAHRRHSPERYHALAARRGLVWLGPEVPNTATKTRWRCAHGHEFDAIYNSLDKEAGERSGCLVCSGKQKKTAADYHALAESRGIEWIGRRVENVHTRTRWRCPEGHEWLATYRGIDRGTGCPCCSGHAPRAAYDYAALGERRGFIWLGPMPATTKHRTNWQCASGHVWAATFKNIDKGTSCPHCLEYVNGSPVSKRQQELHRRLGGYLNYPVNRYRIDIALITDKLMIAVEYDSWYFHDSERDAQRDQVLLSLGWRVLRIKSGSLLPSRKVLLAALERVIAGERCVEIVLHDWEQNYGVTKRVG